MTATMDLAIAPIRVLSAAKVPAARHKIRRLATAIIGAPTAYDVEQMASEAITNALVHGRGGAVVRITVLEKALRVEVRDHGPGLLVVGRIDHGRGLMLIAAFASRWELVTDAAGTCLWFEVDREADS